MLHNHTDFSLDSLIDVSELVLKAKRMGLSAVGVTDHGNISAHLRLQIEAKEAGIKPLFGVEIYLVETLSEKNDYWHLILLAKERSGIRSLCRLVSRANEEGFYYRPRADLEMLAEESEGLVCLTGCINGYSNQPAAKGDFESAEKRLKTLLEIFSPSRVFPELQFNEIPEQIKVNQFLLLASRKFGLSPVVGLDAHYLDKEDAEVHDLLILMKRSKTIDELEQHRFSARSLYFRGEEELKREFPQFQDLIEEGWKNSLSLAESCEAEYDTGSYKLPKIENDVELLKEKVKEGLRRKALEGQLSFEISRYVERLNYEVNLIIEKGLASYFLLYADIADFSRKNCITLGYSRGSVGGCLTAFILGITNVDPLRFGLTFERFLSKEREDLPDIDLDIADIDRPILISYLENKYPKKFYPIIAFSRYRIKALVRDLSRVFKIPLEEVERALDFSLGGEMKETLETALKFEPLRKFLEKYPQIFSAATKIEGKIRHFSRHAAGFVLAPEEGKNLFPLVRNGNVLHCGFDYDPLFISLDYYRLVKFDLLGVTDLAVVKDIRNALKISSIPLDDRRVFQEFSSGRTLGCFQVEGWGFSRLLSKIKPSSFNELSAAIALYRPTTLSANVQEVYLEGKRKRKFTNNKILEEILGETYGAIIYQEQVIELFHKLGGLPRGEAERARKAMTKWQATKLVSKGAEWKGYEVLQELKEKFLKGSVERGLTREEAEELYKTIEKFSLYGFNKAHSVGYALLSYEMMFYKVYYPLYFFLALLRRTANTDEVKSRKSEKAIVAYAREARRYGIRILKPHINKSGENFEIEGQNIRAGFSIIKFVGSASRILVEAQPFRDFEDFLSKCSEKKLNIRCIEYLIGAGVFEEMIDKEKAKELLSRFRKSPVELPTEEEAFGFSWREIW